MYTKYVISSVIFNIIYALHLSTGKEIKSKKMRCEVIPYFDNQNEGIYLRTKC